MLILGNEWIPVPQTSSKYYWRILQVNIIGCLFIKKEKHFISWKEHNIYCLHWCRNQLTSSLIVYIPLPNRLCTLLLHNVYIPLKSSNKDGKNDPATTTIVHQSFPGLGNDNIKHCRCTKDMSWRHTRHLFRYVGRVSLLLRRLGVLLWQGWFCPGPYSYDQ